MTGRPSLVLRRRKKGPRWTFHNDGERRLGGASGDPIVIPVEHLICDLSLHRPETDLIAYVMAALSKRHTREDKLMRVVRDRMRLPTRAFLLDVLKDSSGIESVLEYYFDDRVVEPHQLPRGTCQAARSGRFHDLLLEEFGVLIELDGRLGHAGSGRFRDFERDNDSLVNGLVTLRYGWSDVIGRPCAVAGQVATVLRRRGWDRRRARCPRCDPSGVRR